MAILDYLSPKIGELKIKNFICDNFNEIFNKINPDFDSEIFQNYASYKSFVTKYCDSDLIKNYRDHRKRNLLSLCIPKSIGETIELMLKTFLPKNISASEKDSELQTVLNELDKKDLDNMNYIDYAVTNRKTMVTEYLKSIHTNQKMPEIRSIEFSFSTKTKEIINKEKNLIKE